MSDYDRWPRTNGLPDHCPRCAKPNGMVVVGFDVLYNERLCQDCRLPLLCCQGDEDCEHREAAIANERSAIVKWLRSYQRNYGTGFAVMKPGEPLMDLADAIERGEHLK